MRILNAHEPANYALAACSRLCVVTLGKLWMFTEIVHLACYCCARKTACKAGLYFISLYALACCSVLRGWACLATRHAQKQESGLVCSAAAPCLAFYAPYYKNSVCDQPSVCLLADAPMQNNTFGNECSATQEGRRSQKWQPI